MSAPQSLFHERHQEEDPQTGPLKRVMLTLGGYYSKESTLMRGAELLYAGVVEQATNPVLMEGTLEVYYDRDWLPLFLLSKNNFESALAANLVT